MRSLGDKISSMIVAESADVPQVPWSGSGLRIDTEVCRNPEDHSLVVPKDVYLKGCVTTAAEGLAAAEKIGFPVMIKASEGGGGKGIRKVTTAAQFPSLFRQVLSEVPGSPVFIMKLASGARHLEVQLLADKYGECIALHGRDCSVQRRHQKIIEEGPAAACPPDVFDRMEKAAVRLGKLVGYVSTGTVEYLFTPGANTYVIALFALHFFGLESNLRPVMMLDVFNVLQSRALFQTPAHAYTRTFRTRTRVGCFCAVFTIRRYCFLELNPRLQVEHPCSEMITNVNLPAAQLQIAMGVPLHRIADIREMYVVSFPFILRWWCVRVDVRG